MRCPDALALVAGCARGRASATRARRLRSKRRLRHRPPPRRRRATAFAPAPVWADSLPPVRRVEGDGSGLAQLVDGRVRIQTTAVWGEALDPAYDGCDCFRSALPVLERQLSPERGKHLDEVCVDLQPEYAPAQKALDVLLSSPR